MFLPMFLPSAIFVILQQKIAILTQFKHILHFLKPYE